MKLDTCLGYVNKIFHKDKIKLDNIKLMEQHLNSYQQMLKFYIKTGYSHVIFTNPIKHS